MQQLKNQINEITSKNIKRELSLENKEKQFLIEINF